jgi:hypothetical protein
MTHLIAVVALDLGHIQVPWLPLIRSVTFATPLWLAFSFAFVVVPAAL